MIAGLVPQSSVVCDIGTDHGYVAIYLAKKGTAQKVIAADIKQGPLMQAEKNVRLFDVENKVETRLSDGFSAIKQDEADTCIIAGMGGETIASILENEKGCKYFILQMQTAHRHLRQYLLTHGYVIEEEAICREGSKMYCALRAKRGCSSKFTETELEIGPYLIKNTPPLFYDYVRYRLYEIESILKIIGNTQSGADRKNHCVFLKSEYENLLRGENDG